MVGTVIPKKAIEEAVILREGGYSLASISNKTGISPATLHRQFKKHGINKGSLTNTAIEVAKQQLLSDAGFVDSLKHQIAASITDDLAHVKQLREASALLLEELMNDKSLPAHYKARGVTALTTGIRLTQEVARRALQVDKLEPEAQDLPELTIRELTTNEIELMRNEQVKESIEVGAEINEVIVTSD